MMPDDVSSSVELPALVVSSVVVSPSWVDTDSGECLLDESSPVSPVKYEDSDVLDVLEESRAPPKSISLLAPSGW